MLHLQKDAVRKAMKVSLQALSADALDSASTLFATLVVGRGSFWYLDLSLTLMQAWQLRRESWRQLCSETVVA
jgi:hypothetical protein